MKTLLFFSFFLLSCATWAQNTATIRGFVNDGNSGEPMLFEKVKLLKMDSTVAGGGSTDVNGLFTIPKVAAGSYIVIVENYKFNRYTENITVKEGDIVDMKIVLKSDNVKNFDEVTVSAEGQRKKTEVLISQISLDKKGLERIPAVGAENDIVGALSVTPGVITTGDQGGQLYVRGGTPIQNKILLDGMTIYSPFHSIGFFSIFETELIKNADIYTGGFDAQYGGRISSIMDITYRDGNKKSFGGKVSVSPFMGKLTLEGPIGKKNENGIAPASYVFSSKHSLLPYTSKSLYKSERINDGQGMPFTFTDLYGKVTVAGDGGSKFSFFGFHNRDSVNYFVADLDWQASGGGMNFLVVPSSKPYFIKGHLNGSSYKTSFTEDATKPRFSSIGGFDLGFDLTFLTSKTSEFNYGVNLGGFNTNFTTYNEANKKIELDAFSPEVSIYVSYRYFKNRWVIQPSFRVQAYPSVSTISPEPRLAMKFNATENFRIKASGGRFSQNFMTASSDRDIVNLFNGLLAAPLDVQETFVNQFGKESNPRNGLQYAWHAVFGFEYDFTNSLSANIEGYYKYFSQLTNVNQNKYYEDVAENSKIDDIYKKDFVIESGDSYGVDVAIKYQTPRMYIWTVYSLGKSERWDGFQSYFPVFDRRHNLNFVYTYLFGKKKNTEINIRWNLASGLPFTPSSGYYEQESFDGGISTDVTTSNPTNVSFTLGEFNSKRLPYYHRLDVTAKYRIVFKNKTEMELIAGVTNAYNRNNIFYINRITLDRVYQFPILPSFGINYSF